MKRPIEFNFITLHYTWIFFMGLLSLAVIYPYGNISAVDSYFFGASASTESGLNTVDVKDLKTYQQLYLYFIPILTNLGFVNIVVVIARLWRFEKSIKRNALLAQRERLSHLQQDVESTPIESGARDSDAPEDLRDAPVSEPAQFGERPAARIKFAADLATPTSDSKTLHIPSPRERDNGYPVVECDLPGSEDEAAQLHPETSRGASGLWRRTADAGHRLSNARSFERAVATMFVLGPERSRDRTMSTAGTGSTPTVVRRLPRLSHQATVGRNSSFGNLSLHDRKLLGGIEYRSLQLLLKIVTIYFFGIHLFGVICLVPWIHRADPRYTEYLASIGQNKTWWAIFSAQTMVNNLGFTLTPDSMISFRDATWPLLLMTFLAFAGETLYPVFLRLAIWTTWKMTRRESAMHEPLRFLLDHPRRCYTLLFPTKPTWILFGIIAALNFVDVLLIIVLDLHNPAVNDLRLGPRVLSAVFQAASARHTGTSTLNLAKVNPAVQFSLVVMMYISIFPICISIRASNTYEERSLGVYGSEQALDEVRGRSYIMTHVKNQLSFDLWYIFLGTFCICISESTRIADDSQPEFSVFSALFEVVSAYGNVGLSLGHPSVNTSLSGQFTTFSKLVICAMMIRGRHRGLPYALDRAVMLPGGIALEDDAENRSKVE